MIHWIEDKARLLAEARRVLKPGGKFGFTSAAKEKPHDVERLRERALTATGLAHRAEASIGIPHKVSSEETRAAVRAAFDAELERLRDAQRIRLERHLIFAVAEKPQVS